MDSRFARLDRLLERPVELYRQRGWWGQEPLWARVAALGKRQPDKPAVVSADITLSYGELWRQVVECRAALRAGGVGRGDVILVQLPNWPEFVVVALAAESAGIIFSFCPIQWGLRETTRALNLIRPTLWVTTARPRPGDDRAALIAAVRAALLAARPQVILVRSPTLADNRAYEDWCRAAPSAWRDEDNDGGAGLMPLEVAVTSGSTGDPKGVVHVHDSALAAVQSTINRQGIGAADVIHLAVPVGHTFGYFYGVRCALQAGATLLLQEKWDAERMAELVARHRATVSLGPSAFALDLINLDAHARAALASLRLFTLAGDSVPAPVARRIMEQLPFRVSRALGMTEFGHAVATDAVTPRERIAESLGTAQPEMELRVVDDARRPLPAGTEGRIVVRGPFLFAGYLMLDGVNENVLDAEGFFDTGDLGYVEGEGYLHHAGRVAAVIRRGAETIPVSVLEDTLAAHPDVVHAVVVGMPDARLGEVPVACVQTHDGKPLRLTDIHALFARAGITKKFWPAELRLFDDWPLGPTGKIDRRLIIARLQQDSERWRGAP
jgi:non-ribosomal peptide synthetase component E (peptide arylation enzyme)